ASSDAVRASMMVDTGPASSPSSSGRNAPMISPRPTVSASRSITPTSGPSTSQSASPSNSPTPTSTPSPSKTPKPSQSPSPSTSTTPSKSPSPSKSPTQSPSPSKSPSSSKSPTKSPTPKPGVLCVTGELVRSDSRTSPGGTVTYSVWLWSTVKAKHVTANVSSFGTHVKAQRLSLCPSKHGKVCSVGELPANQQFEVVVTDKIGKNATPGEQIGVTVNVQGVADTGGPLSPAEASVATVLNHSSSSSNPPPGTVPPVTIPPTNPDPGIPGTTVTPPGLSSLFPTITPSSGPPTNGSGRAASSKKHGGTKVETVASSSPIDPKLIGGQLAGLAV